MLCSTKSIAKVLAPKQFFRLLDKAYKMILDISRTNQMTYKTKNLWAKNLEMWKNLPFHIKSSENLQVF